MSSDTNGEDIDAKEVAYIAYFNAILEPSNPASEPLEKNDILRRSASRDGLDGQITCLENLRDGRVLAEILHIVDQEYFSPLSEATTRAPFALLRRIYHSLLSCPSCLPLSYLPAPDLESIPSSTTSRSSSRFAPTSKPEEWQTPLLELCHLVLIAQAVYGRSNAFVVGKIRTELGLVEQKTLKECIEDGLIYIAEQGGVNDDYPEDPDGSEQLSELESATITETQTEFSATGSDLLSGPGSLNLAQNQSRNAKIRLVRERALDREAKRFYDLQNWRRRAGRERDEANGLVEKLGREVEGLRGELEETKTLLRQLQDRYPQTPIDPQQSANDPNAGSSGQYGATGGVSTGAQQALDKIKDLEMDTLRGELSKRDEELRHQESLLEQNNRSLSAALQRNSELQVEADQLESLKDELEITKHSTEKLRKSENVVMKLKKKLEETANDRQQTEDLRAQITSLQEANAMWEEKYAQMLARDSRPEPALSSDSISEARLQAVQVDLEKSQALWHEARVDLQDANHRIKELEAAEFFRDDDQDDERGGQQTRAELVERIASLEAVLEAIGDPAPISEMSLDQKMRALGWHEKALLLTEKLKASEAKLEERLSTAEQRNHQRVLSGDDSPPSPHLVGAEANRQSEISDLRSEVTGLRDKMLQMQRSFQQEKMLLLKAWDDLGQRTMRISESGQPIALSWLEQQRQNALASPRLRRSKA